MGDNALVKTGKKLFRIVTQGPREKRIGKLNVLSTNLQKNTQLIVRKYDDLKGVKVKIEDAIEKIKGEEYNEEFTEIDNFNTFDADKKEEFKNQLLVIKDQTLNELDPIIGFSQNIQARMLVTLHKANNQVTVLKAKSELASNMHLQLETLKTLDSETLSINKELEDLLAELESFNKGAVEEVTAIAKKMNTKVEESTGITPKDDKEANIAEVIQGKFS